MPDLNAPPFEVVVVARCNNSTTVVMALFGERFSLPFQGTDHDANADKFVEAWSKHLGQAWVGVRETSAHIMAAFTEALRDQGVGNEAISRAVEAMRKDAET